MYHPSQMGYPGAGGQPGVPAGYPAPPMPPPPGMAHGAPQGAQGQRSVGPHMDYEMMQQMQYDYRMYMYMVGRGGLCRLTHWL
jgi:hypothetical protein